MTNTRYAEATESEQAYYLVCGTTDAEYNALTPEELAWSEKFMACFPGYVLH